LNKAASHNELKTSNKKSKKRKSDEAINELDFEISEEGKANKQKNDKESLRSDDNSQNKVTTKDKVVKKRKSYKVADDLNQQESKINERKDGIASLLNKVDKTEQLEVSDKLNKLDINNDKKDKDKLSVALVKNTPLTVQQKRRGRRQILKSRSYVNERGYTVHENYHEWESFSEGESISEKMPQKVIKAEELNITAKRGKKKKGDNGSQKSLLNFFGKK
jgi:DNA polymerase delta subunit 3